MNISNEVQNERPIDRFVKRSYHTLQKKYVVIGKRRVSSFIAWTVIAFFIGVTIAIAFLASRSGTLEGSYAAGSTVYQASTDFTTYAGKQSSGLSDPNRWMYLDGLAVPLTYSTTNPNCGVPCWYKDLTGVGQYLLITSDGQHPGNSAPPSPTGESIRAWVAPSNGTARIQATVRDTNGGCGDGVHVRIKQGDSAVLWDADIPNNPNNLTTSPYQQSMDKTVTVTAGQSIYFMVGRGAADNYCDSTSLDPTITFTPDTSGGGGTMITYQASSGFSSTNGAPSVWSYIDGKTGQKMTNYYAAGTFSECGSDPCWRGSESYMLVKPASQHPGATKPSIRQWTAPGQGNIRVTGTIKDWGGTCGGDGVLVEIGKAGFSPQSFSLADGDTSGIPLDISFSVSLGSVIYFKVSPGANNWCDTTYLDPKIEFTPTPPPVAAGKVTVKKTFFGISVFTPTLTIDGKGPDTQDNESALWNAVSAGNRTLTTSLAPNTKAFYAACTNADDCLRSPNEGSSVTFTKTGQQNDAVRFFYTNDTTQLTDGEAPLSSAPIRVDDRENYNFIIGSSPSCSADIYTDASDTEYKWITEVAAEWKKAGIVLNIIRNVYLGSKVKVFCLDMTGEEDSISAMRFGDFNLKVCEDTPSNGITYHNGMLFDVSGQKSLTFHSDIAISRTTNPPRPSDPVGYAQSMQRTISHELGHFLGLQHSGDSTSIMYPFNDPSIFPLPTQDAINQVKKLYPQCAPKTNTFSISLTPNPAKWQVTPPATPQCGPKGNRINPNGDWWTRLYIQAPSSGDITLTKQVLKLFDVKGNLTQMTSTKINWPYQKDTSTSQNYYILPNKKYVPARAELTLSGKDDKGNPVQATALVNLEQGNYYLTNAHCSKGGNGFIPLFGVFFGSSSCAGNCKDL